MLPAAASVAQPNNPQNNQGRLYFESVNKIVGDIKTKGFRGADQKSLDYYKGLCNLQVEMTEALAANLYKLQSSGRVDAVSIINQSKLSTESKTFAMSTIKDLSQFSAIEKAKYFEALSSKILDSKIDDREKQLNLFLTSVAHYAYQNNLREPGDKGCTIIGENGSSHGEPANCVALAAVVGAFIGFPFCGPLCSLGGAIVFGVLAAIAVC